jgi:hypothetical protein
VEDVSMMNHVWPRPRRVMLIQAGVVIVLSGCSSTQPTDSGNPIQGRYLATWTESAAVCAPQPLPPAQGGTSQYAQVPSVTTASQVTLQIDVVGSTIRLAPTSTVTDSMSSLIWQGTVLYDSAAVANMTTRTEGPRLGGHTFFVEANHVATGRFYPAIQSPPGNGVQVSMSAAGADTFTFRDGGPTGTVFTTCVVPETVTAEKILGGS